MSKIIVAVSLMMMMISMVAMVRTDDDDTKINADCKCNFFDGLFCGSRNLISDTKQSRLIGNCEKDSVYFCPGGEGVAELKSRCPGQCILDDKTGMDHCAFV
ncbi:uncharacterized protein LOC128965147 [Oppia nitens]|uniref:uncharacterized protein LOC128965147 n=1 Tax=Oppia nitens TaxID=1686743 RepID=UPI0023D9958D|nr:uncharacterized protein LOC128965147 [Oppia nitens]